MIMKLATFFLIACLASVTANSSLLRGQHDNLPDNTSSARDRELMGGGAKKPKTDTTSKGGGSSAVKVKLQRPTHLTFIYTLPSKSSDYQTYPRATCVASPNNEFPSQATVTVETNGVTLTPFNVEEGSVIEINADFGVETTFTISGWGSCIIHTSCSQPLIIGDQLGPFLLAGDEPYCQPVGTPTNPPTPDVTPPCIVPDKTSYNCGDPITVNFFFEPALIDDWIGIYPCDTTEFMYATAWQWACGNDPRQCTSAKTNGTVVFDRIIPYNAYGPHIWPISPKKNNQGGIDRCYKVVLLRAEGPSTPPYNEICESVVVFDVMENNNPGCAVREANSYG